MTVVRRFNVDGVDEARRFVQQLVEQTESDPKDLLVDDELTQVVPEVEEIVRDRFVDRRDAAEFLHDLLEPLEDTGVDPIKDVGLWAWLALHWIDLLAPVGADGGRRPGEIGRWIPAVDDHQKYYRHLLAGPYQIYRAHRDQPDVAMALLATAVNAPGEIVEQFASRQDIVTNPNLLRAITLLYYDSKQRRLKPGAARKGSGGARRLADLLLQLDLTYDIHVMEAEDVLGLLPAEFDEFKN